MIFAALALQLALTPVPSPAASFSPTAVASPASAAATADASALPAPVVTAQPLGLGGGSRPRIAPLAVPSDGARIANSGSTNLSGYQVVVDPSGAATATDGGAVKTVALDKTLVAKFFTDLSAAAPLDTVAPTGCMKSASFGSSTSVSWHGTSTGDLSCGRSPRSSALEADIQAIVRAAGVAPHGRTRRMLL